MPFPFNADDQALTQQAILAGVAGVSAGSGAIRVSSITAGQSVSFNGDAANNRVSAIQDSATNLNVSAKSGDAGTLRVSAFQGDAGSLMVSAKSGDAGLLRISAIGGTAGDRTIVDGVDQSVSARIKQISAVLSASDNAFIVHAVSEGAGRMQVSAKSDSAALLRVSSFQDGAASLNVSAKSNDGALLRTSAIQEGAAALNVSAKSNDGALLRVSAVQDGATALNVSAKSGDGGTFRVSALQGDAGTFRVSAFQGDAANLRISSFIDSGSVSAKSGDGANLRVSAIQDSGTNLNVSAKSDSANLLRTSSFDSAVTTNTGGASLFSTSAGIAQTSAIKSSGGRLYGWYLGNPAGVDQYFQIFNASATTSVGLGTTVPDMRFYVPTLGGANVPATGPGIGFSNGIVIAVTSTADGNTAGASGMRVNIFYA